MQQSGKKVGLRNLGLVRGDLQELLNFYKDARALLQACETTFKSALYERDPLLKWSVDNVTLLGDACHPMLPFL
ncbi:6-hydroxynicotinate 3-monooxygenase, partial [Acinetobacter baumannii]